MDATLPYQNQIAVFHCCNACQREPVGTIGHTEIAAAVGALEYGTAMPDHHDGTVSQTITVSQTKLQRTAVSRVQADCLPGRTKICRTEQMPAQAIDQQRTGFISAQGTE